MKPYRPAQRTGAPSANRIRERYLHQLGLQRGSQPQGPLAAPTHQVVVIGLPSLPEERETNVPNLQLESHDFSNYQKNGDASQHTVDSEMGDSKALSGDSESDPGSSQKRARAHSPTFGMGNELNVPITSLALSYPTALLKPPPEAAAATSNKSNGNPIARWFSKGAGMPQDSKPQHLTDQDSVTSTATSTTAGSSFSAMVSKDWSAPHNAEPMKVERSASASSAFQGVHYRGNSRVRTNATPQCVTSSLAHALHRFNIDSDCEASIASGSVAGGASIMTEDEDHAMDEDDASVHSHASFVSMGSHRSNISSTPRPRSRKAGKAQRLLDRAAAHERIIQMRNEQSQKTRANLVHIQRMGHQDSPETRSRSNSNASSHSSVPLLYVQHGNASEPPATYMEPAPPQPSLYGGDLSRTPTASNCSELKLRRIQAPAGLAYPGLNRSIPAGVHLSSQDANSAVHNHHMAVGTPGKPLLFHPQLASAVPPSHAAITADTPISSSSSISAHESLAHRRQTSVEDVLEVVEALSKLKGKGNGSMIPRVR